LEKNHNKINNLADFWKIISSMKSMTYKGSFPAAVIVAHQVVVFALHTITHAFHPLPDQERFSHCQRQFGRTGTTLGYHTTSHPAGHSIH
jgi:hypothetical protein